MIARRRFTGCTGHCAVGQFDAGQAGAAAAVSATYECCPRTVELVARSMSVGFKVVGADDWRVFV